MSRWETALADAEQAVTGTPAPRMPEYKSPHPNTVPRSRERIAVDDALSYLNRLIRHLDTPEDIKQGAEETKARIEEILR